MLGAGAWGGNVFSANGVFQCDITGAAGQPRGRDELFDLYNHCYVNKAVIEVSTIGNATNYLLWGVAVRDDTTAFTDLRDFAEYRNSKWSLTSASTQEVEKIVQVVEPYKWLGMNDPTDDAIRQDVTANPSEGIFFHVGCVDVGGGDPGACLFMVKITYYCKFCEPFPLAAS